MLLPGLLWGRVPRLFMTVAMLYGALDARRSPLDPVLRSLLTVRVSQLNWCRFCVDINSATLARRAGSMAKVEALEEWRTSNLYSAPERAALDYTEAMTITGRGVTDELMAELRRHYTDDASHRADGTHRLPEPVEQVQQRPGCTAAGLLPAAIRLAGPADDAS